MGIGYHTHLNTYGNQLLTYTYRSVIKKIIGSFGLYFICFFLIFFLSTLQEIKRSWRKFKSESVGTVFALKWFRCGNTAYSTYLYRENPDLPWFCGLCGGQPDTVPGPSWGRGSCRRGRRSRYWGMINLLNFPKFSCLSTSERFWQLNILWQVIFLCFIDPKTFRLFFAVIGERRLWV